MNTTHSICFGIILLSIGCERQGEEVLQPALHALEDLPIVLATTSVNEDGGAPSNEQPPGTQRSRDDSSAAQTSTMARFDKPSGSEGIRSKLYAFKESNLNVRFPIQPKVEPIESGHRYSVAFESTNQSIEAVKVDTSSREELFDRQQQAVRDNSRALIIESTPIKWEGHFGREWSYFHDNAHGTKFLTRCWDIVVEGMMLKLRYESVFVPSGNDPDLMRKPYRDAAQTFFDSVRLINKIESTQKVAEPSLLGRWIVVRIDGKDVDKGDVLAFSGGTKFGGFRCGNENEWSQPGGGVRQRGFYKCTDEAAVPSTISIHLLTAPKSPLSATCQFTDEALALEFEVAPKDLGLGKSIVLRRPGDKNTTW